VVDDLIIIADEAAKRAAALKAKAPKPSAPKP
jgi:hypothetical protein